MLSRVNKLDRDFLHCQLLSFVWPLRNHVTMLFFTITPLARARMAVVVNKVYCNVVVLRIVPHVREPGFRNGEKFCSGIRNTAQEIRNPTNSSHFLILEVWVT